MVEVEVECGAVLEDTPGAFPYGSVTCTLPRGHHGDHQAWAERRPAARDFLTSWPHVKPPAPRVIEDGFDSERYVMTRRTRTVYVCPVCEHAETAETEPEPSTGLPHELRDVAAWRQEAIAREAEARANRIKAIARRAYDAHSCSARHGTPSVVRLPHVNLARLAGPVLVRSDDEPWPPDGWTVGTREPCAGDHRSDEDCDLCRGQCLDSLDADGPAR